MAQMANLKPLFKSIFVATTLKSKKILAQMTVLLFGPFSTIVVFVDVMK